MVPGNDSELIFSPEIPRNEHITLSLMGHFILRLSIPLLV